MEREGGRLREGGNLRWEREKGGACDLGRGQCARSSVQVLPVAVILPPDVIGTRLECAYDPASSLTSRQSLLLIIIVVGLHWAHGLIAIVVLIPARSHARTRRKTSRPNHRERERMNEKEEQRIGIED